MKKLNDVLTLAEVAEELNISKSTVRMRLKNRQIDDSFFRKTKEGTYIFLRKYVEVEKKIS